MRALLLIAAAAVAVAALPAPSSAASKYSAFCSRWNGVCQRTCPPGVRKDVCFATCADRRSACLENGCYHFNKTGDECYANRGKK
jgi:hypothetical protein